MKLRNLSYSNRVDLYNGLGSIQMTYARAGFKGMTYFAIPRFFSESPVTQSQNALFAQGARDKLTGDTSVDHFKLTGDLVPSAKGKPASDHNDISYGEVAGLDNYHRPFYLRKWLCSTSVVNTPLGVIGALNVLQTYGMVVDQPVGVIKTMSLRAMITSPVMVVDKNQRTCSMAVQTNCTFNAGQYSTFTVDVQTNLSRLDQKGVLTVKTWRTSQVVSQRILTDDDVNNAQTRVYTAVRIQHDFCCAEAHIYAANVATLYPYFNSPKYLYQNYAYSAHELLLYVRRQLNLTLPPPDQSVWGDLSQVAIDSCKWIDINSIAYVKDLRDIGGTIRAAAAVAEDRYDPKAWVSLALSAKYGDRLTYADTKELMFGIVDAANTLGWRKTYKTVRSMFKQDLESSGFSGTRTLHYKVYYRDPESKILNMIKNIMDWDFWLTLENDWDLIPFSFIVDWFVGIGDFFQDFDTNIYSEYLDVVLVTRSVKTEIDVSSLLASQGCALVDGTCVHYNRTSSFLLDLPVPSFQATEAWHANLATPNAIIMQKGL